MKEKILITRPMFADVVSYLQEYFEVEINEAGKYDAAQLKEALRGKSGVLLAEKKSMPHCWRVFMG
jgi:hypothetical protein